MLDADPPTQKLGASWRAEIDRDRGCALKKLPGVKVWSWLSLFRNPMGRRARYWVDGVELGAKPGELPNRQPSLFKRVVKGCVTTVPGLCLPQLMQVRAQKVIR